jgi:hypothetical protein
MTVTIDASVKDFTPTTRKLFIDGEWVDAASGKSFYYRAGTGCGAGPRHVSGRVTRPDRRTPPRPAGPGR